MPLSLNSLSQNERQFLVDHLPEHATDTQVQTTANALLDYMRQDPELLAQAVYEVMRIVRLYREAEIDQAAREAGKHYVLATKDTKRSTPKHPVWQPYRVRPQNLAAFAKANGISERDLLKVARGEVDEIKGIRQGQTAGNLGISRSSVIRKHIQEKGHPTSPSDPFGGLPVAPAHPMHFTDAPAAIAYLDSVWWTPPAE